jgi:crotonobetainyl-CoA:carnitine CoA-transferase CaiB-like acyl-CoA transferase
MPGPLHGVRILELAHIILGPMACQILADMGAEVIKVEAPTGDGLRTLGARNTHANMASLFLACNRNKRSVVLDLKNKSSRKLVLQLAESADVVLHNNRPQVMTKLGLDYADFKAVNPSIIYCGAYGYSTKGPYGERGAMDEAMQAGTGISLLNKDANDVARSIPTALADKTTALTAAYSILGALLHRQKTGEGQEIEVTMFETMVNYVMADHQGGLTFSPPHGKPGYAPILDPAHKPAGKVNQLEDLFEDPHLKAVDFWKIMPGTSEGTQRLPGVPITFADTPADIRRPPPRLGEHSFEVLRELGLNQGEIDVLVAEGATFQA